MSLIKIGECVKKFLKNEDGASAIEYVIIVAMVAVVVVGLSPGIGKSLTTAFGSITTALTPASSTPATAQ